MAKTTKKKSASKTASKKAAPKKAAPKAAAKAAAPKGGTRAEAKTAPRKPASGGAASQPALDAGADEWAVYADALQQAGDPRGELIALAAKPSARDAFVKKNAEALLGKAGKHIDAYRLTWRHCFVDEADVLFAQDSATPAHLEALLESPAAANLRGLTLTGVAKRGGTRIDLSSTVARLRERGLPESCVSLQLVDDRAAKVSYLVSRDYDPGDNLVTFGELDPLWGKLKGLQNLRIVTAVASQNQLGELALPELRSFTLHCLHFAASQAIAAAKWPKLESLELRLPETFTCNRPDDSSAYTVAYTRDEDDEGGDDEEMEDASDGENYDPTNWATELAAVAGSFGKLPLKRLALTSFDNTAAILQLLESAPLPASLEELDLSDSSFDEKGADRLLKAGFAKKLKKLVLERVSLPAAGAKKLGALGAKVVHSTGSAPTYRYVVGME